MKVRLFLALSSLILASAPLSVAAVKQQPASADVPFGWATALSLTEGSGYELTGGDPARTVVLLSNGMDMREDVIKAVKDYDVIVFDGARGDFIISSSISFRGLRGKSFLGVNGARIRTQFEVTPEIHHLLDSVGVKSMSDQGGGGLLSNGARVAEEREQHVRQAIIDRYGDATERYRRAGLFGFAGCENIILRIWRWSVPEPSTWGVTTC